MLDIIHLVGHARITMKKSIITTIAAIIIPLIVYASPARAGLSLEPFIGLSGTSFTIFLLDVILEADGELMKEAGDDGLITGDLGLQLDIGGPGGGVRLEGLIGYYKYRVFDPPATAYYMFMAGIEPYIGSDGLYLGAGGGVFKGGLWNEVLNTNESESKYHSGWAAWGTVGALAGGIDFSARVRYHRFSRIDGYRPRDTEFHDDWVVVIRAGLPLNLL